MTIGQALARATTQLSRCDSPRLDAEVVLAELLGMDRTFLIAHDRDQLDARLEKRFLVLIKKRRAGMPVAYLTGHKEFHSLDFFVTKNTLIPRPETELIVDAAVQIAAQRDAVAIADIGTGCGAIAITLKHLLPHATVYASDISKKALAVAERNARRHTTTVAFRYGNLLMPFTDVKLDIITANLPYLDPRWIKQRELTAEPRLALAAGSHGMDAIRRLLKQVARYHPHTVAILEIDPRQENILRKIAGSITIQHHLVFAKDAAGLTRAAILLPHQ